MMKLALLSLCAAVAVVHGSTQEGLDFLAAKATEDGVVSLPSGLLYKVCSKYFCHVLFFAH